MNIFYANCKYENWDACKTHRIFGIKKESLPNIEPNDLILFRITGHSGQPYGVRAIWICQSISKVTPDTFVPWHDSEYSWIIHYTPIIELSKPFSEEFATSSKISQKLQGLYATRLMGSMGELNSIEAATYLTAILKEFEQELSTTLNESNKSQTAFNALKSYIEKSDTQTTKFVFPANPTIKSISEPIFDPSEGEEQTSMPPSFGLVGEKIDLPILNYAPLNEMGVILLFGYYMRDLGLSHLEEIRADFPDAIGMQQVDGRRYRRVRIEFEYKSKDFVAHGHSIKECDIIVCWENNWPECPIEIIELRSALFRE